MMKGVSKGAMAVRLPDGSIDVEDWDIKPKKWYNKCPVIRGSINFVQQLREGYSCLMKSADKSGMMDDDSEEEQSKFEKWLDDKFGDKLTGAIMAIARLSVLHWRCSCSCCCRAIFLPASRLCFQRSR